MKEQRIGFFLTPTFAMLPFITAVETLRVANEFSDQPIYSWRFITLDGQPVISGNSMEITADSSIEDAGDFDIVIVAGAYLPNFYHQPRAFAWLRSVASKKQRCAQSVREATCWHRRDYSTTTVALFTGSITPA